TTSPLTVTTPASMSSSALRREQMPELAINLFKRINPSSAGSTSVRLDDLPCPRTPFLNPPPPLSSDLNPPPRLSSDLNPPPRLSSDWTPLRLSSFLNPPPKPPRLSSDLKPPRLSSVLNPPVRLVSAPKPGFPSRLGAENLGLSVRFSDLKLPLAGFLEFVLRLLLDLSSRLFLLLKDGVFNYPLL